MRVIVLALALLTLCVSVPNLGERDFWPPDEARYGQITRELGTASWVIPQLNGGVYHDKPPLWFWTVRGLSWLTGAVDETSTRWPSVIGLLLMMGSVSWVAGRVAGSYSGLASGLILLTTALTSWHSHVAGLDMLFGGLLTVGILCWFLAFEDGKPSRLWWGFVFLGLATLVKGPHALLACAVLLVWKLSARSPAHEGARQGRALLFGVFTFLAMLAGWAYLTYREAGFDYLHTVVLDRGLDRIREAKAHQQPWWFFAARSPVNLAPWLLLPLAWFFPAHWSATEKPARRLGGFALVWLAVWLGIVTALPGKRSIYMIPAVPAFALLAGLAVGAIAKAKGGMPRVILSFSALVIALVSTPLGVVFTTAGIDAERLIWIIERVEWNGSPGPFALREVWANNGLPWPVEGADIGDLQRHMRLFGLAMLIGGLTTVYQLFRHGAAQGFEWCALTLAAGICILHAVLLPHVDREQSRRGLGETLRSEVGSADLKMIRHVDEGAVWYFGRPMPVLDAAHADGSADWSQISQGVSTWLDSTDKRFCLIRTREVARLEGLVEGEHYKRVRDHAVGHDKSFTLLRNHPEEAGAR